MNEITNTMSHRNASKHEPDSVQQAWVNKGSEIGRGEWGTVYKLNHHFNGQSAVIKEIILFGEGHKRIVQTEIHNLWLVNQFLAHGYDVRGSEEVHYIVMKYMGVKGEETGLPDNELAPLRKDADERYRKNYGVIQINNNKENYVYREVTPGRLEAEIVDWAYAGFVGEERKALPPVLSEK
ncbi:hypothetical protein AX15_004208 [Amanita polypyramis BW_CC]|nr:hypothetical protein AX15_004208 [Amanita polypyramis BW_CC]